MNDKPECNVLVNNEQRYLNDEINSILLSNSVSSFFNSMLKYCYGCLFLCFALLTYFNYDEKVGLSTGNIIMILITLCLFFNMIYKIYDEYSNDKIYNETLAKSKDCIKNPNLKTSN